MSFGCTRPLRSIILLNFRTEKRFPILRKAMSTAENSFKTLKVHKPAEFVYQVELNRPEKRNAMNPTFWKECFECFNMLANNSDCRAIVVSGAGKLFTSGLDLTESAGLFVGDGETDTARKAFAMRRTVMEYQNSFTAIEKCPKPVIAAVHGGCVGGGVDLVVSCDIRYCTQDAWFQIKEVDIGLAADVGTLQRLPKVVGGHSVVNEWVYTARKIESKEALEQGLVSRVFDNRDQLIAAAIQLASTIASKSPIAVQGSKINLIYARDNSVQNSLEYIATWNQAMLQTEDIPAAFAASVQKIRPTFAKL